MQQSCTAAATGDLCQADMHFHCALNAAAHSAGLRRTQPGSSRPTRPFKYPWFDSRCASLKAQIKQGKRLGTSFAQLRPLQRRYQTQIRHSLQAYNCSRVQTLSALLKTNPRQFWQGTRLPCNLLPEELRSPAAWDAYLATLTAPPAQPASRLPQPHTSQPPTPATSLNQPFSQAEIESALQKLHNGRSGALLGYSSELLRYARLCPSDEDPAPPHLLLPCLQLLFNTAFSTGSVPQSWKTSLVTPILKGATPQTRPTTAPLQLGNRSAGCMLAFWRSGWLGTLRNIDSGPLPRLGTDHTTARSIRLLCFSMSWTSTDTARPHCTYALWTSNLHMIGCSGSCFGAPCIVWASTPRCRAPSSPCTQIACSP